MTNQLSSKGGETPEPSLPGSTSQATLMSRLQNFDQRLHELVVSVLNKNEQLEAKVSDLKAEVSNLEAEVSAMSDLKRKKTSEIVTIEQRRSGGLPLSVGLAADSTGTAQPDVSSTVNGVVEGCPPVYGELDGSGSLDDVPARMAALSITVDQASVLHGQGEQMDQEEQDSVLARDQQLDELACKKWDVPRAEGDVFSAATDPAGTQHMSVSVPIAEPAEVTGSTDSTHGIQFAEPFTSSGANSCIRI